MEDALIKLSSRATDILGVSSRALLAAMIAGEGDPRVLAELAKGRLRVKKPAHIPALTGSFDEHHGELADVLLSQIDSLTAQIEWLDTRAAQIIAEVGPSMEVFPTSAHLVSWSRISPRAVQSGARTRPRKTGKGNSYLKGVLGEAAASAGRTNTFLGARYGASSDALAKQKALVAVARSILVIVWNLLADPTCRHDRIGPERR